MKEVTLYGGTIDSCLENLREMAAADESGELLKAVFNDKYLLSTDTDDDAYLRITGMTKAEHDEYVRKWQEDYEAKRKAHEARIPELTEHYRKVARGVIIESELEYWDEIVPIRLGDLYRGMELDQVLDCARVMRDETLSRIERLRKAYKIFNDAGHSGMSAGLTMAMLRRFCPDGNELADACNEFRYEPDHKTKLYVSRDGDGKLLLHFAYPHWGDNHDFRSPNQVELNPLLFPEVKPGSRVEYIAGEVFDTIR